MRGLPDTTQCLWMWLCSYADGYGQCWPSRTRLMKDMGVKSVRTVDTHMQTLENLGWIEKTKRWNKDKQTSNLYQLNLVESPKEIRGANIARVQKTTIRGAKNDTLTKPIELNKEDTKKENERIAELRRKVRDSLKK